jgi:hypothetical protein
MLAMKDINGDSASQHAPENKNYVKARKKLEKRFQEEAARLTPKAIQDAHETILTQQRQKNDGKEKQSKELKKRKLKIFDTGSSSHESASRFVQDFRNKLLRKS